MKQRFAAALLAYAVLALLTAVSLDGLLRMAVWVLLAGLAVKTWVAYKRSAE